MFGLSRTLCFLRRLSFDGVPEMRADNRKVSQVVLVNTKSPNIPTFGPTSYQISARKIVHLFGPRIIGSCLFV